MNTCNCLMQITTAQLPRFAHCLPRQRGNVKISTLTVLNALLHVRQGGDGRWTALPAHYGDWRPIYARVNRWSRSGVLDRVIAEFDALAQAESRSAVPVTVVDAVDVHSPHVS
jgi:transposase